MANNIGSDHQSRPPIRLLISVLLLGTLLAWWGTRDHRHLFGESPRGPVAAAGMALPQVTQEESALLDRGFQLSERECAGCHEMATRSSPVIRKLWPSIVADFLPRPAIRICALDLPRP